MPEIIQRYWERVRGFIKDVDIRIDARWVLREEGDERAHGSLRIVGYEAQLGVLKPGYVRAYVSFVTSRKPKTPEEIQQTIEAYQIEEIEHEIYSINEHIKTSDNVLELPLHEAEKMFGVKVFEKNK